MARAEVAPGPECPSYTWQVEQVEQVRREATTRPTPWLDSRTPPRKRKAENTYVPPRHKKQGPRLPPALQLTPEAVRVDTVPAYGRRIKRGQRGRQTGLLNQV